LAFVSLWRVFLDSYDPLLLWNLVAQLVYAALFYNMHAQMLRSVEEVRNRRKGQDPRQIQLEDELLSDVREQAGLQAREWYWKATLDMFFGIGVGFFPPLGAAGLAYLEVGKILPESNWYSLISVFNGVSGVDARVLSQITAATIVLCCFLPWIIAGLKRFEKGLQSIATDPTFNFRRRAELYADPAFRCGQVLSKQLLTRSYTINVEGRI
jgi:hypothetical protein